MLPFFILPLISIIVKLISLCEQFSKMFYRQITLVDLVKLYNVDLQLTLSFLNVKKQTNKMFWENMAEYLLLKSVDLKCLLLTIKTYSYHNQWFFPSTQRIVGSNYFHSLIACYHLLRCKVFFPLSFGCYRVGVLTPGPWTSIGP